MNKLALIPAALLTLGLCSPSFADEKATAESKTKTVVKKDDDGNYSKTQTKTSESTDESGTTTKSQTKVEVESDADGNAERKVISETSTDPKGLMNKSKTVTTDTIKYKDGQVEKKYQKKVDGKVVEENMESNTAR